MLGAKHGGGSIALASLGACFLQGELVDVWIIQALLLYAIDDLDDLFDAFADAGMEGEICLWQLVASHRAVEVC